MQKDSPLVEVRDGDEFNYELAIQGYGVRTNNRLSVRIIGYGGRKLFGTRDTLVALVRVVGGEKLVIYDNEGFVVDKDIKGMSVSELSLAMDGSHGKKEPVNLGRLYNYSLYTRSCNAACLVCDNVVGGKKFVIAVMTEHGGETVTNYDLQLLLPNGNMYCDRKVSYDIPGLGEVYDDTATGEYEVECYNMIPFDIYALRGGCMVIDEEGYGVEILCTDRENNGTINIIGLDTDGNYLQCDIYGKDLCQPDEQVLFMDMDCYLSWLEKHKGLKKFDLDMVMDGHGLKTLKGDSARIIKVWKVEKKLTVLVNTKASHEDIREYDFEGRWLEDKSSVMEMLLVEENKVV